MTASERERAALGGPELRAALVERGVLRPAAEDRLLPIRLPPDLAVLRLDEAGRRLAAGRVALGRRGKWDLGLDVESGRGRRP